MTDWLPVVGVALAGTFTTLGLMLKGLGRTAALGPAWRAYWITVVLSTLVYALYLIFDERWVWYT